jgi:hypothetical protein
MTSLVDLYSSQLNEYCFNLFLTMRLSLKCEDAVKKQSGIKKKLPFRSGLGLKGSDIPLEDPIFSV